MTVTLRSILATAVVAAIIYSGGCTLSPSANQGANATAAANPTPTPAPSTGPHMVTDLTNLSSANTVALLVPGQLPTPPAAAAASKNNPDAELQANIDRFFTADVDKARFHEASAPLADTTLMNAKAQKFDHFAYALLKQTLAAAETLESEKFEQRKLSSELKPVVLTAVMTAGGTLTEIAIEQHSGDIAVDRLVIEACKRGLWARNPPKEALASDGTYRLRIQGIIYNHSFNLYGKYTYDTRLGLAIL